MRQTIQPHRESLAAASTAGGISGRARRIPGARRAFSLLDVLISISVIGVLISLTLPTLSTVRETTNRVVCASHIRELLIGAQQWASDHRDELPPSVFSGKLASSAFEPHKMQAVRVDIDAPGWDGLGLLWQNQYGVSVSSYYCPAHTGDHRIGRYFGDWPSTDAVNIVSNYHMRAIRQGPGRLARINPSLAFIADGLASRADFNHRIGGNVGRFDLSVGWYSDPAGSLAKTLPERAGEDASSEQVERAWRQLDSNAAPPVGAGPPD